MYFDDCIFQFGIYCSVCRCSSLVDNIVQFSKVDVTVNNHTCSVWEFQLLQTLANTWNFSLYFHSF